MDNTTISKRFIVVDLREQFSLSLLENFYNNIILALFPIKDEVDPIEEWIDMLSAAAKSKPNAAHYRVILLIDRTTVANNNNTDRESVWKGCKIAAGCVSEYYPISNCALLSYFAVSGEYRKQGLGEFLVRTAVERTAQDSHRYLATKVSKITANGRPPIANAVLNRLEPGTEPTVYKEFERFLCNSSAALSTADEEELIRYYSTPQFYVYLAETNAFDVHDGILPAPKRHQILRRIGFALLDFDYVQPPLGPEHQPCYDLVLLSLESASTPKEPASNRRYIHPFILAVYMWEFALACSKGLDFQTKAYFRVVQNSLTNATRLYLKDTPWNRRTPLPTAHDSENERGKTSFKAKL